ncbi:glutamate receptor ionotropic, NMDA 3B-like [Oratosquilla oratoria]|uniref:glutamate receptor ionotropic, NMDA 3B-like n=1 Tax=Oratosquilla oratoria TaxID=337810 RepID=UPI003F75A300
MGDATKGFLHKRTEIGTQRIKGYDMELWAIGVSQALATCNVKIMCFPSLTLAPFSRPAAPKSWPNKVLINVWGAFSVIFVASYTANIAALFAGLFQTRSIHDRSMLSLRVGAVRSSAAEHYLGAKRQELWAHMRPHLVDNFTHGLYNLHAGKLDLLVGDTAVLDYMRANDPGCTLRPVTDHVVQDTYSGDHIVQDTYAIAMVKGLPLRVSTMKGRS